MANTKKFLLPVDDSLHSTYALQYIGMMAPVLQEAVYSLYYVQPVISEYLREEAKTNPVTMEKLKHLYEKNEDQANDLLTRHKEGLLNLGVPAEKIELCTRRREKGLARDILQQAREQSAEAIIIGRHGYSRFEDTFIGSTTKNVIEHCEDIPIWMIDGEITSKNILLAVDGSLDSAKALDYLCEILKDNPDMYLTIFHVEPSLRDSCGVDFTEMQIPEKEGEESFANIIEKANRQCFDNFMGHAGRKLKQRRVNEDRLHMKTQPTRMNVGRAIAEEFRNGDYGSLVVGKRGMNKRFFMGSVSNYLVTHLENGALWIVP